MSLQEASGSYWGLTRQVGPYKPTSVDKARANSQYNGTHSGHADWHLAMNPTPLRPISKKAKTIDTAVVVHLDYKQSNKTVGRKVMVKNPVGATQGGDNSVRVANNYYTTNFHGGPASGGGGGPRDSCGGGTDYTSYYTASAGSPSVKSEAGVKDEDYDYEADLKYEPWSPSPNTIIPRTIPRAPPVKEETHVPDFYLNNYIPVQYPEVPSAMDLDFPDVPTHTPISYPSVPKDDIVDIKSHKPIPPLKIRRKKSIGPAAKGVKRESDGSGSGNKKVNAKNAPVRKIEFQTKSTLGKRKSDKGDTGAPFKKSKRNFKAIKAAPSKGPKGIVTHPVEKVAKKSSRLMITGPKATSRGAIAAPAPAPARQAIAAPRAPRFRPPRPQINTNVPRVAGPQAGKRGQGKSMDKHIPIPRKQRKTGRPGDF